ncbi:Protein of unknown function [Bacillus toyonensis]|nr:Protein of unknown function [Bacillus toyonensis]
MVVRIVSISRFSIGLINKQRFFV